MYGTLTKIAILEGKISGMGVGRFEDGNLYLGRDTEMLSNKGPADIKVDDMVLVAKSIYTFLKTTQITKILEQSENYIKFETETSIYEFEVEKWN